MNPKKLTYNTIVIGGGSAGIAAALASQQNGCSTILIERLPFLGGMATAAEVGTICGIYANSSTDDFEFACGGFPKEFAERLQEKSGTEPQKNRKGLKFLPYSVEAFKQVASEYINESGVELLLNATVTNVRIENTIIQSIIVQQNESTLEIHCSAVIDTSGISCISDIIQHEGITSSEYQSASQLFTIKNIQCSSENQLTLVLMRTLEKGIQSEIISSDFRNTEVVTGSFSNGKATLKMLVPHSITHEKDNLELARELAINRIKLLLHFLTQHSEALRQCELDSIAPVLGFRTGKRTLGKYILTIQDVLEARKFDTAVASGTWPIESWDNQQGLELILLPPNDYYEIPAECLISKHAKNLFVGGRNISATEEAIASARVMGTCLQTGYAAGVLASEFVK